MFADFDLNTCLTFLTLVFMIVIGCAQICLAREMNLFSKRQDERDEKFRRDSVNAEVVSFIQKYNRKNFRSDIHLLPLCVMAYKYDPTYPYRRKIYRDFCSRTETVREQILARRGLTYDCKAEDMFYENIWSLIDKNRNVIWGDSGHFNYFYNRGYFNNTLIRFGEELQPFDNFEFVDEVEDLLLVSNSDDDIEFRRSALDDYFRKSVLIDASYLCCLVSKYTAKYYGEFDNESSDLIDDYEGKLYMEDMFLDALFYVYFYRINSDK